MVDESHTNKTFQRAAKNAIIVTITSKTTQKPPRQRLISNDQMDTFHERDTITSLADLNETTAPDGFQFKKSNNHTLFYNLVYDKETKFPKTLESIKADSDLYVQL